METFVRIALIFVIGGSLGWVIELIYRRLAHKKWINPGFLVGPCLPMYGTGLVCLYLLCLPEYSFIASPVWKAVFVIALLGVLMTLVEYVTGLVFIVGMKVKLWDYSKCWGNIQGIICPLFSFFWTVIAAVYYLFVHKWIVIAGEWIGSNPLFSFFVGMYLGVMLVDVCYSFHIVTKLRKWAAEHKSTVTLEELKLSMKVRADKLKQKIGFLLPFRGKNDLTEDIEHYKNEGNKAA